MLEAAYAAEYRMRPNQVPEDMSRSKALFVNCLMPAADWSRTQMLLPPPVAASNSRMLGDLSTSPRPTIASPSYHASKQACKLPDYESSGLKETFFSAGTTRV